MTDRYSLYRAGARDYERHADANLCNAGYERPAMVSVIGEVAGLRIIDAGCAAGWYSAALSARAESVLALDVSPEMIGIVREKRLRNVEARVHDLSQPLTWLSSASIDLIVSSLALHYLASWHVTLSEFHRALVPGGRLIVSTHHPEMTRPLVANYFETQPVHDTWNVAGVKREIWFYHRPMSTIVNEFVDSGFILNRLYEPRLDAKPAPTADERKLATQPWFLIIEARKPKS